MNNSDAPIREPARRAQCAKRHSVYVTIDVLRQGVRRGVRHRHDTAVARHGIDDPPRRRGRAATARTSQPLITPEVDLERPSPVVVLVFPHVAPTRVGDAGVVADNVDGAAGVERVAPQRPRPTCAVTSTVTPVTSQGLRAQPFHACAERARAEVGGDDLHPSCPAFVDRLADPTASTGDDRDPPG
jgi:hypothetical protein